MKSKNKVLRYLTKTKNQPTRQEIAEYVGITSQMVNVYLGQLEREKIIRIDHKKRYRNIEVINS